MWKDLKEEKSNGIVNLLDIFVWLIYEKERKWMYFFFASIPFALNHSIVFFTILSPANPRPIPSICSPYIFILELSICPPYLFILELGLIDRK